jgi:hypothetical protein
MQWLKALGMMLLTSGIDGQATIAMVIIAVFGFEVVRVLVKKPSRPSV